MASKKKKIISKVKIKLILTLIVIITVLAAFVFLLYSARKRLFTANRHFTIRKVLVKSGGWWKNRVDKVSDILNFEKGKTNLFSLDYSDARDKLIQEPSIEDVFIYKCLPDTLVIEIVERIPRAFLKFKHSNYVVDGNSIIMPANTCVNLDEELPVINDLSTKKFLPGRKLNEVNGALKLLDEMGKTLKRIKVIRISLKKKKIYNTIIYDRKAKRKYNVLLARDKVPECFSDLDKLLNNIKNGNSKKGAQTINLSYKGLAFVK
jgi:cell division septal protein FtsQ